MGVWGPGLLQNDTSADAELIFKDAIKEGKTPSQAVKITLNRWKGIDFRSQKYIQTDVYLGIAVAQIELGCLQEDIKEKTIKLIDIGATHKGWFSLADKRERIKILQEFKETLVNHQNSLKE